LLNFFEIRQRESAMEHAVLFFWFWIGCILCGGAAAERSDRFWMGALLGFLWGPIGVIAALGLAPNHVGKMTSQALPPMPPNS
jgi:hypothetical protein